MLLTWNKASFSIALTHCWAVNSQKNITNLYTSDSGNFFQRAVSILICKFLRWKRPLFHLISFCPSFVYSALLTVQFHRYILSILSHKWRTDLESNTCLLSSFQPATVSRFLSIGLKEYKKISGFDSLCRQKNCSKFLHRKWNKTVSLHICLHLLLRVQLLNPGCWPSSNQYSTLDDFSDLP